MNRAREVVVSKSGVRIVQDEESLEVAARAGVRTPEQQAAFFAVLADATRLAFEIEECESDAEAEIRSHPERELRVR